MRFIAIAGAIGSGKDTVADFLCERHRYLKIAWADALYMEVRKAYGLTEEEMDRMRERDVKEKPNPRLASHLCSDENFVKVLKNQSSDVDPAKPSPRAVLQLWGTEYRRKQSNNYWVEKVVSQLAAYHRMASRIPATVEQVEEYWREWVYEDTMAGNWDESSGGYALMQDCIENLDVWVTTDHPDWFECEDERRLFLENVVSTVMNKAYKPMFRTASTMTEDDRVERDEQITTIVKDWLAVVDQLEDYSEDTLQESLFLEAQVRDMTDVWWECISRLKEDFQLTTIDSGPDMVLGFRPEYPGMVIVGTRFDNEVECIREIIGGEIWHVVRPKLFDGPASNHASDRPVVIQTGDKIIFNNGTRGQLKTVLGMAAANDIIVADPDNRIDLKDIHYG